MGADDERSIMDNKDKNELVDIFYLRLSEAAAERKTTVNQLVRSLGHHAFKRKNHLFYVVPHVTLLADIAQGLDLTCDYLVGLADQSLPEYSSTGDYDSDEVRFSVWCRFLDLIEESGYSTRKMSEIVHSDIVTINRWINRESIPETLFLFRLCRHFGYSFDYMIGLTEEKKLPGPYVP